MSMPTLGPEFQAAKPLLHSAEFGPAFGTPILTAEGILPVEYLGEGDRIITRAGLRRLRRVNVHVASSALVVRIDRDVLGQGRPACDLMVRPQQPVLIRDWRAKVLYGAPQAMIAAERLVDGQFIRLETVSTARFFELQLDDAAVIYAGGAELMIAGACVPA